MKTPTLRRTKHLRVPNGILSNMSENKLLQDMNSFSLGTYVEALIKFETEDKKNDSHELLRDEKQSSII